MKIKFSSYWLWFYLTISLLSLIDYIEHISRPEQSFAQNKLDWFIFTFSSNLTLCLATAIMNFLLIKLFKSKNIIFESLSILFGLIIHICLTGPLYNKLFYPQSTLTFFINIVTLSVGLILFYIIRLTIYFILRLKSNANADT
jgi:hypothetical protein